MNVTAFENALTKGLGRAALVLTPQNASLYRDALLHAVRHDLRFDQQCEDRRGPYLWELIQRTGESEIYRDVVCDSLAVPQDDAVEYQLAELAYRFARNGDLKARQTLYSAFAHRAFSGEYAVGSEEIIRLDGIHGLLYIVLRFRPENWEEELWQVEGWTEALEERDGKQRATEQINEAVQCFPELAALVAQIEAQQEEQAKRFAIQRPRPSGTCDDILKLMETRPFRTIRARLSRGGKFASETDFRQISENIPNLDDAERVLSFLGLFRWRSFPGDISRMRPLVLSADWEVSHRAAHSIAKRTSPEIRALALELAECSHRASQTVELLTANACPSDHALIESLLVLPRHADNYHQLGITVREFFETNPDQPAAHSLLRLYEDGLCTTCRNGVVRLLEECGEFPEILRAECRYDADADTRAVAVGQASQSPTPL